MVQMYRVMTATGHVAAGRRAECAVFDVGRGSLAADGDPRHAAQVFKFGATVHDARERPPQVRSGEPGATRSVAPAPAREGPWSRPGEDDDFALTTRLAAKR